MEWCKVVIAVSVVAVLTECINSQLQDFDICHVLEDITLPIGTRGRIRVNEFTADTEGGNNQCIMRAVLPSNANITIWSNNYKMPYCGEPARTDKKCIPGCSYMFIYEPFYPNATYKEFRKNWGWSFSSLSNNVLISLCFDSKDVGNMVVDLEYQVNEKMSIVKGSYVDRDPTGVVTSPNFPFFYSLHNEIYRTTFSEINGDGYIVVTFDDWHLSEVSSISFLNSDNDIPSMWTRPVVLSSGPHLTLSFSTGMPAPTYDTTYMGFHATYEFIDNKRDYEIPDTNCGSYLLNSRGGTLTFSPPSYSRPILYDCIWVVKMQPIFDRIYMRLEKLSVLSEGIGDTRLKVHIRPGLTSLGDRLYTILPGNTHEAESGYISDVGFYVRLRGKMSDTDIVTFTYASYSDINTVGYCYYDLFQCRNMKCIDSNLACDGHDHCGDNSDETDSRCEGSSASQDYLSYSVIIPMVVAIFVIVVICLLVIFVRRCQHLSRQPNDRHSSIQSISGNLTRGRRPRGSQIRMNVTIQQDMGDYPPSYDEVMQTSTANIGYLNMAFLWSQNDISANADPPPYSENAPVILSPAALLDSSSCSSSDGASPSSPVRSQRHPMPSSSSDSSWDGPRVDTNSSTSESDFSSGNINMYATVSLQRSEPGSNVSTQQRNRNPTGCNSLQRHPENEEIMQHPRNDASQERRSQTLPSNEKRKNNTALPEACVSAADIEGKAERKKQRRTRRPHPQDCTESQESASRQNTGGDNQPRGQQTSSSGDPGPEGRRAPRRGEHQRSRNTRNHSEERSHPRSDRPRDQDRSDEVPEQSRSEQRNDRGRSENDNELRIGENRPSSNYERVAVVRNGDILTLHLPSESGDICV